MNDGPTLVASPFTSLADFAALPRVIGLVLSPEGDRLITSLWEVDPAGRRRARRLTRSDAGESAPASIPAGDLLFLSARPVEALPVLAVYVLDQPWVLPEELG